MNNRIKILHANEHAPASLRINKNNADGESAATRNVHRDKLILS